MYSKKEIEREEYEKCPHCGKFKFAKCMETFFRYEAVSGWKRLLPWNWIPEVESETYIVRTCRNCKHTKLQHEL